MRVLLQILLVFFTWFTSIASFAKPKVFISNYNVSFPKTENIKQESEVKIGKVNYAISSFEHLQIQTTIFHPYTYSLSSNLNEGNSVALDF